MFSLLLLVGLAVLLSSPAQQQHKKQRQRTHEFLPAVRAATADDNSFITNQTQRGVVMCAANGMIQAALQMIWHVQYFWKAPLGVSVFHCAEISDENKRLLRAMSPYIHIIDLCHNSKPAFGMNAREAQWRLRGFFCKVAGLVRSPFEETMLVDLDVVWFKKPSLLFESTSYRSTGALFFRDRVVFRNKKLTTASGGIIPSLLNKFFEEKGLVINETTAHQRWLADGISLYWHHGALTLEGVGSIADFQESSVLLMDKRSHRKTIRLLEELLPSFSIGYGDKEIYWIAATLTGEDFTFEPFLPGQYGDCAGTVFHYDPNQMDTPLEATPFYSNSEYMLEDLTFVGEVFSLPR